MPIIRHRRNTDARVDPRRRANVAGAPPGNPTGASGAGYPAQAPPPAADPTAQTAPAAAAPAAGTATAAGLPAAPPAEGRYVEPAGYREGEGLAWQDRTRLVVTPIAAPSILGLFGFMGATVMLGGWFAGWYGTAATPLILFPFIGWFGGVAQLAAALHAYRARDGLATAVHGLWGSFWIAFAMMQLLVLTGTAAPIPLGTVNASFAWWFIVLCSITMMAAFASLGQNLGMFAVLVLLAGGSGLTAAAFYGGWNWLITIAGYVLVASAAAAWYTASALMLKNSYGRTILPVGARTHGAGRVDRPIQYETGMPGARIGQ
jgi:succinate-acetate transporter protein